ncbi:hypothetical protein NDU88_000184 [Pleurodeles waltl]|uniref:Uncharacterized protein n=1 Tax=Pleurodeles waltl TaxID=8319 RepID=A0AAV7L9H1_PLEWA|nr:hypothetical protein NDU88_000184 [Pleurodeles waltl]
MRSSQESTSEIAILCLQPLSEAETDETSRRNSSSLYLWGSRNVKTSWDWMREQQNKESGPLKDLKKTEVGKDNGGDVKDAKGPGWEHMKSNKRDIQEDAETPEQERVKDTEQRHN